MAWSSPCNSCLVSTEYKMVTAEKKQPSTGSTLFIQKRKWLSLFLIPVLQKIEIYIGHAGTHFRNVTSPTDLRFLNEPKQSSINLGFQYLDPFSSVFCFHSETLPNLVFSIDLNNHIIFNYW